MSLTVACAADMASPALTLTFGAGCDPPLGSNARMTVSQNTIRNRNRMGSPRNRRGPSAAALDGTIAARLEAQVGDGAYFLPIFEFNQLRCFGKFELSAFASNLRQRA